MANTLLTADEITRAALAVLHQKSNFIKSINKQYDSSFAKDGAKIGDSLRIRLPNEYTVRTGMNMAAQNTSEESTTLTVSSVKGVDMQFTSTELALDLQDFTTRVIEPAMSVLAANIEADALSMYKDVYNLSDEDGTAATLLSYLKGRKILNDNLAPNANRKAVISTAHAVKVVDNVKGLFHSGDQIKQQYTEGMLGRTAGFDFMENTLMLDHTTGTAVEGDTLYNVNGATQSGSTIAVNTGATTFLKGDVVTFAGCNRVHPETKGDTGQLQQFVITADSGANATSLSISPALTISGPRQNVTGYPTNAGAVVKVGAGASETLSGSLVFVPDAFTFATADLPLPQGVDFASRQVMDGISMSIVRDFNISDRTFPCRLDVLYGYKALRPQWACRIHADG